MGMPENVEREEEIIITSFGVSNEKIASAIR